MHQLFYSKMPDQTNDHLTPATRLLEKRREMAEVEHALSTQKEVSCNSIIINNEFQSASTLLDSDSIECKMFSVIIRSFK